MGIGVYTAPEAEIAIIDHDQVYGEFDMESGQHQHIECEDDFQFRIDDLVDALRELLPVSFRSIWEWPTDRREGVVIAENEQFRIRLVDWGSDFFVCHEPQPDLEDREANLAKAWNEDRAYRLFRKMSRYWDLRCRTSSWTTGPHPAARATQAGKAA